MKKLMLDLDTLRVESFATQPAEGGRGTVRGHDTVETENCSIDYTCFPDKTCLPLRTCGVTDDVAGEQARPAADKR